MPRGVEGEFHAVALAKTGAVRDQAGGSGLVQGDHPPRRRPRWSGGRRSAGRRRPAQPRNRSSCVASGPAGLRRRSRPDRVCRTAAGRTARSSPMGRDSDIPGSPWRRRWGPRPAAPPGRSRVRRAATPFRAAALNRTRACGARRRWRTAAAPGGRLIWSRSCAWGSTVHTQGPAIGERQEGDDQVQRKERPPVVLQAHPGILPVGERRARDDLYGFVGADGFEIPGGEDGFAHGATPAAPGGRSARRPGRR